MDNQMINFPIRASCSYTWHKNRLKNKYTVVNIIKCIKTLLCAIFNKRNVKLCKVEAVYNHNNNHNTIFGREYKNHLEQRRMTVLHNAMNYHNNSTYKAIIMFADEFKKLIDDENFSFSSDIHYIVQGDFTYRNNDIMDIVLPDYLTIIGNLDFYNHSNLTHLPENITVTGSVFLSGCSSLTTFPESLNKINGSINLCNCTSLIKVPETMESSLFINLSGCSSLKTPPKKIITGTNLNFCYCINIDHPPESIHIGGHAIFYHCTKMGTLPAETHIGGNLYISATMPVPKEAHINGRMYLNFYLR